MLPRNTMFVTLVDCLLTAVYERTECVGRKCGALNDSSRT